MFAINMGILERDKQLRRILDTVSMWITLPPKEKGSVFPFVLPL